MTNPPPSPKTAPLQKSPMYPVDTHEESNGIHLPEEDAAVATVTPTTTWKPLRQGSGDLSDLNIPFLEGEANDKRLYHGTGAWDWDLEAIVTEAFIRGDDGDGTLYRPPLSPTFVEHSRLPVPLLRKSSHGDSDIVPYPPFLKAENDDDNSLDHSLLLTVQYANHGSTFPPATSPPFCIQNCLTKDATVALSVEDVAKVTEKKPTKKGKPKVDDDAIVRTEFVGEPTVFDVLCGRGERVNRHSGNKIFHEMKERLQRRYLQAENRKQKKAVAQELVDTMRRTYGSRFLVQDDKSSKQWYVADDKRVLEKVKQVLREHFTPEERRAKREWYAARRKQTQG